MFEALLYPCMCAHVFVVVRVVCFVGFFSMCRVCVRVFVCLCVFVLYASRSTVRAREITESEKCSE